MSDSIRIHVKSREQTTEIARALAQVIHGGMVISLEGDLGAGKTFFTRELLAALGYTGHVTSPTFVLEKIYHTSARGISTVHHYDVYRMEDYGELADIGFEELDPDALAVVEWGNKFADSLPPGAIRIAFDYYPGEERIVHVVCADKTLTGSLRVEIESRLGPGART